MDASLSTETEAPMAATKLLSKRSKQATLVLILPLPATVSAPKNVSLLSPSKVRKLTEQRSKLFLERGSFIPIESDFQPL